ncbi:MAG: TetR/AcrR family transcriptional regulator [Phycisphaerales bacterium]|nr:TetR/AcrR family transcriptional regulator [Phycisphaerales bacterium]
MVERAQNRMDTKVELRNAAVRLGVREGVQGASIRTIAREAGVTEGAVYKHFVNKDELIREAYTAIVDEMARDKQVLLRADLPFKHALRAWVKLTFEYFDGNRDAFTYVLLMPHQMAGTLGEIYQKQGEIFWRFLEDAQERGEAKQIDLGLGYALFTGCVLNIPRLIQEGALDGPAQTYGDEIAEVVIGLLAV